MSIVCAIIILSVIGTLDAQLPDIDINRVRLLQRERVRYISPNNNHSRRSIVGVRRYNRYNDNDNHSRGFPQLRAPLQILQNTTPSSETKTAVKFYQPREDPRLFYQSASYIKETNRKNINHEVMSVYPGREVIRAGDEYYRTALHRVKKHELNDANGFNTCIKCPQDRTLIAKVGANRVILQYPRLTMCSGKSTPKKIKFQHLYGPKFGSLLEPGSHTIIGRISYNSLVLQTCKMQINVLMQFCHIPHYLIARCEKEDNKTCNFACREPKMEIQGSSLLTCGDDMKWLGHLPACGVRTWCHPLPPPEHGRITCKGSMAQNGWGLQEGSSCRLKCPKGWRWVSRRGSVCHRSAWTRELVCQPKKSK